MAVFMDPLGISTRIQPNTQGPELPKDLLAAALEQILHPINPCVSPEHYAREGLAQALG